MVPIERRGLFRDFTVINFSRKREIRLRWEWLFGVVVQQSKSSSARSLCGVSRESIMQHCLWIVTRFQLALPSHCCCIVARHNRTPRCSRPSHSAVRIALLWKAVQNFICCYAHRAHARSEDLCEKDKPKRHSCLAKYYPFGKCRQFYMYILFRCLCTYLCVKPHRLRAPAMRSDIMRQFMRHTSVHNSRFHTIHTNNNSTTHLTPIRTINDTGRNDLWIRCAHYTNISMCISNTLTYCWLRNAREEIFYLQISYYIYCRMADT